MMYQYTKAFRQSTQRPGSHFIQKQCYI